MLIVCVKAIIGIVADLFVFNYSVHQCTYVSDDGIQAATEMEFVTKLKTFAMDLKTRLLPYV